MPGKYSTSQTVAVRPTGELSQAEQAPPRSSGGRGGGTGRLARAG